MESIKGKEEVKKNYFNIRVEVKFDNKTLSILDIRCSNMKMNRSKYIRQLIENDITKLGLFSKDERIELYRIGNNLNQNTRFANSNKMISSQLETTLQQLENLLNNFCQNLEP